MKKVCILLFATALMLVGCDNKKKDLTAQSETLMKESDSIEASHQKFEEIHKEMMTEHEKFTERLKGMEVQDSTLLGDLAKHEVILKSHDAIIESHADLIAGHKQLKADFDQLSEVEMEAQLKQIEEDHDRLMKEHATMEEEHEMMMKEHQDIKEIMTEGMETDSDME
ncbi:hypothetical protein ESY86_19605 [Subsaximicrobium wynnwilliamsii]|uniref:Lipoprotein n=1 Tax=Subsaximicrobium wynnwilliamsii TaxID=291179 RepID=A0A5C6ZBH7_9FLAO|nr:hypothetical protein [Subsaximicrobium wynnwilliamsii]TXD80971.1 hypothetical protein ESY87_19680 [Subsaximicrobium wynnwilliamsii]TXD86649.1 hypothetical protein ESY86_19605 [Subsaximicrobium wynnwilliamsii]TXE00285.1 hypothetical protein ESY88_19665 [Subsaximicrobium wynnwilliamsii]